MYSPGRAYSDSRYSTVRNRWQFSLRSLLVCMVGLAVTVGVLASPMGPPILLVLLVLTLFMLFQALVVMGVVVMGRRRGGEEEGGSRRRPSDT